MKRSAHFFSSALFGTTWLLSATLAGPASAAPRSSPAATLPHTSTTVTPPTSALQKTLLVQMQDAFTQIARTVEPTVVNIKAIRPAPAGPGLDLGGGGGDDDTPAIPTPRGRRRLPSAPRRIEATGSGVIVRPDGYILTNDHVVEGAANGVVTVTLFDGREFPGKVYPDFRSDLAIVKIDAGTTPLPVAQFAPAGPAIPGQWALAVGSPFDLQNTFTVGVISAINRHQQIGGEGSSRYYPDLIQTDAAINPGNSGGPLFNIDGKVVGINVAIESPVEGSAGVGFAIPVAIAQQVATDLITQGKVVRGYLGLTPEDLTPALVTQYGQPEGAFIRDVKLSSPAGLAGLQAADVVTSYDGKPIRGELDMRQAIAASRPGQKVSIRYTRDGQPGTAVATISPSPSSAADAPASPAPPAPPRTRLGVTVRALTARDRQTLALPAGTKGVVIASVVPGSPAESGGLVAGMVVQRVNQTPVGAKTAFDTAVTGATGAAITLVVLNSDPTDSQVYQRAVSITL